VAKSMGEARRRMDGARAIDAGSQLLRDKPQSILPEGPIRNSTLHGPMKHYSLIPSGIPFINGVFKTPLRTLFQGEVGKSSILGPKISDRQLHRTTAGPGTKYQ